MILIFDKINTTKSGDLYKVHNVDNQGIPINLFKTTSLFGVETIFNNKYFKWTITNNMADSIELLENSLIKSFAYYTIDAIDTKLVKKYNYPVMITTKIKKKLSNDVISHEPGELTSFNDINKASKYNVKLLLDTVFVKTHNGKKTLYYTLEIINIAKNKQIALIYNN